MIVLKQVIKYDNANVLEATWVDSEGAVVRCHAYADVQMDDLIADLGEDVEQYADLIAEVRSGIVPAPAIDPEQIKAQIRAEIAALEQAELMPRATREALLFLAEREAAKLAQEMSTPEMEITAAMVLAQNYGYQRMKQLDDRIRQLREQT